MFTLCDSLSNSENMPQICAAFSIYNIVYPKAPCDLNCVKSAVKPQPTNRAGIQLFFQRFVFYWHTV